MIAKRRSIRIRVGQRGTVVIPADVRRELQLLEGDELELITEGDAVVLTKIDENPVAQFRELGARYFAGIDPVAFQRELRDDES